MLGFFRSPSRDEHELKEMNVEPAMGNRTKTATAVATQAMLYRDFREFKRGVKGLQEQALSGNEQAVQELQALHQFFASGYTSLEELLNVKKLVQNTEMTPDHFEQLRAASPEPAR